MRRYSKYALDPDRYDFEEIYSESEARLCAFEDRHILKYRTKTIKAGNVLECEIYPIWDTPKPFTRVRRYRESTDAQKRLNKKNALKKIIRLINENFTDDDIWATNTYAEDKLPKTVEEAEKIYGNFLRRLKYYAKKKGFPELKYVYMTEFEADENKGKHRVHHHLFTNFPDRDVLEKLWKHGARTQTRRLQADENGYEGAVRYCMKDPRGTKRYKTSKNLRQPQITIADYKVTRKRVKRLVFGKVEPKLTFEQMYRDYKFIQFTYKISDYVSGAYLYAKMTKRNN